MNEAARDAAQGLPGTGSLDRLIGLPLPSLRLRALGGLPAELAYFAAQDSLVVYFYPGVDARADPTGQRDSDFAQARGFVGHHLKFATQGFGIVGISSEPPDLQRHWAAQTGIKYCLASDRNFALADRLGLPTTQTEHSRTYQHLTLIVHQARVNNVSYPVERPEREAERVAFFLCEG